ncbi:MAG: tyrosine-type recombinase/integrase [Thermoleophilia bacterium]|nr:tyrosine-type recombinase/integrase [Thermoleophilia bacterium]
MSEIETAAVSFGALDASVNPASLVRVFVGGLTPATRKLYLYSLESFRKWSGCSDLHEVATRLCRLSGVEANLLVLKYHESLSGRPPSTVNALTQGIRSLVKLARMLGLITWSLEVQQVKVERYRDTRGPGTRVMRQLLDETGAETTPAGRRNLALLRVMHDLALRRASVASLDLENWERESRCLWVLTKGRAQRRKKDLPEQTQRALEEWVRVRGDTPGPLFLRIRNARFIMPDRLRGDGIYRIVVELGRRVKSPRKARPHGIRHTAISAATRAARAAHLGLEAVMAFSDHQNVQTLKFYLDEEDGLQRQVSQMVAAQLYQPTAAH